jgi:hypothetical protein
MSPNDLKRARTVANSWLLSWNIDSQIGTDSDLLVRNLRVDTGSSTGPVDFKLDPKNLIGGSVQNTLHEMWRLTEHLQLGRPLPNRPPNSILRARKGDYEGISLRLTPFSKTANPPEHVLARYRPIVQRAAAKAAYKYRQILRPMAQDQEDLESIGMVYLTLYLHRHQDLSNQQKNEIELRLFLQQEFARWAKVSFAKLQNITQHIPGAPPEEIVGTPIPGAKLHCSVQSNTLDPGNNRSAALEISYSYDPCFVPMYCHEDPKKSQLELKRKEAKVKLESKIKSLQHEKLVEELGRVILDRRVDGETWSLANKIYRQHCLECPACASAHDAWEENLRRR